MLKEREIINLVIPKELREEIKTSNVIAFEGVDGCGKSSLCEAMDQKYEEMHFIKLPEAYTQEPFKHYLHLQAPPLVSAMIYAASLVDRKNTMIQQGRNQDYYITDRSLWSTVALNWARNPELAQTILDMYASVREYVAIPKNVYVLDVPYEVCRERISYRKKEIQKYDEMFREEYEKHMSFYSWLSEQNVGVTFFNPGDMTQEQIARVIHDNLKGGTENE